MKKIIKKFWGVALLLVLLSTLFVAAIPQAAAMNYEWFNSFATPGNFPTDYTLAANSGVTAVAQSGSTIICTTTNNVTGAFGIWRSTNGGTSWAPITPTVGPTAGSVFTSVAIAPDDANIIALVANDPVAINARPQIVWLTKNGGVNWTQLGVLTAGAWVNDIAIAPISGGVHRVTVGGNTAAMSSANLTYTSNAAYLVTYPLDAIAPAWAAPALWPLNAEDDNVMAVAYSPNYLADYALMVVTYSMATYSLDYAAALLHCYSYNTNLWDANIVPAFPRVIESAATTGNVSKFYKAQIVLDSNFFLGDEALQTGFIATSTQASGGTAATNATYSNIGGVYRLDYSGAAFLLYQIYTGASNSAAWDGTNLMAADYNTAASMGALIVRRSANALSPVPTFSPNSVYKVPGTGFDDKVLFNATSGLGLAFSQGNGAGIAKTSDYGKTWNSFMLVNSHFNNINDWWISPSGSVIYAIATDNIDMNLWKGSQGMFGYSWERVFTLWHVASPITAGDPTYIVRADKANTNNIYLGLRTGKPMFKSTDGGTTWSPRSCAQNIQDMVVLDANTVIVAVNGAGTIVKTTSGALSWTDPPLAVLPAAGGTCNMLNQLSGTNILLAGTWSGVAYTTDGSAWTYLGAPLFGAFAGGIVDATGLAAGDTIFVGNANEIATWTIGTSFMFAENAIPLFGGAGVTVSGMVYTNGVLYTLTISAAANVTSRWLYPTDPIFGAGVRGATDTRPSVLDVINNFNNAGQPIINPLKATVATSFLSGSTETILWARNGDIAKATVDTLDSYTEYLTSAADGPTVVYPKNNALITINSISGAISNFNYVWDAPKSIADTGVNTGYDYDRITYLDAAGTNPVEWNLLVFAGVGVINTQLSDPCAVPSPFAPGTTYYWRVRVAAGIPLQSRWSAMESFVIEQLVAIVPVIASPTNGSEVNTTTPAFSWSPIAGATMYRFELASDVDFSTVIYTVDTATAGAAVPTSLALTRGYQYYWHVKTLTPQEGQWSETANFIVAALPPTSPTPTTTIVPTPTYTVSVTIPPGTTQIITVPPAEEKVVNPSYIWAIIIVGAVLVIAVIVLIVRTRRTV